MTERSAARLASRPTSSTGDVEYRTFVCCVTAAERIPRSCITGQPESPPVYTGLPVRDAAARRSMLRPHTLGKDGPQRAADGVRDAGAKARVRVGVEDAADVQIRVRVHERVQQLGGQHRAKVGAVVAVVEQRADQVGPARVDGERHRHYGGAIRRQVWGGG